MNINTEVVPGFSVNLDTSSQEQLVIIMAIKVLYNLPDSKDELEELKSYFSKVDDRKIILLKAKEVINKHIKI